MTVRLTIRRSPWSAPPYYVDAIPGASSDAIYAQMRGVPGVRWVTARESGVGHGIYRGPADAVEIAVRTLEAAKVVKVTREEQLGRAPIPNVPPPQQRVWHPELRGYQQRAVDWLIDTVHATGAAELADEMGVGKTPPAIVAADELAPQQRVVVVCPAMVRPKWGREIKRWSKLQESPRGGVGVQWVFGDGSGRERHVDAFGYERRWDTVSYEELQSKLKKDPKFFGDIGLVILDEVHYIGNPKSQRSKAVDKWLAAMPKRPLIITLSGTPMTARVRDLWHTLDVQWPGRFGSWWDFTRRYCDGRYIELEKVTDADGVPKQVWSSDGASRLDELYERLTHCILRRTKAEPEIAREMPARNRVIHEVDLSVAALRSVKKAAAAISATQGYGKSASSILSCVESYKIDHAVELAESIRAAGGKVLLLTTRVDSARAIAKRLPGAVVATGEDGDGDEREAMLATATIGVSTLQAVTVGIDLVQFDNLIMVGLDWVPSTMLQGESRIHRIGQQRNVTIYYLVGLRTLDERVRELVLERLDVFGAVVGGDSSGLSGSLAGGSEDDILASLIASMKGVT